MPCSQDLALLFVQKRQGILGAPIIEHGVGLFVAHAGKASPARVKALQRLVTDSDALLGPSCPVDIGIAGHQVLGHADGLGALLGIFPVGALEQCHYLRQSRFPFQQAADPIAHLPMAYEDLQPRLAQGFDQRLDLWKQRLSLDDFQVENMLKHAIQRIDSLIPA